MDSFKVSWHAAGYTGSHNYIVVAESLREAKKKWEEFIFRNPRLKPSWDKANKAMKHHYGGYVTWKENGPDDREEGCYDAGYNAWNAGSDHLRD